MFSKFDHFPIPPPKAPRDPESSVYLNQDKYKENHIYLIDTSKLNFWKKQKQTNKNTKKPKTLKAARKADFSSEIIEARRPH